MTILTKLQDTSFLGNSALTYVTALVFFLIISITLKIFQVLILKRLKNLAVKTANDFDDILIEIFDNLRPPFYLLVSLFFSLKILNLNSITEKIITVVFMFALVFEIVKAAEKLLNYLLKKYLNKSKEEGDIDQHSVSMIRVVNILVKIVLWILGISFVLSNLGLDITSIVASLGIGGIAIALALQNVLSDIFSSFSIYVDKPFQVGDFIVIGTDKGTVEKIGLKTTRIRTLQGEELVVSNRELTSTRVQNFKKLEKRRVSFTLGITYGTANKKIEKIPEMIKNIIEEGKNNQFDRCHFSEYGSSSLDFETVYYIKSSDYNEHMDEKQRIHKEIYKLFEKEGIKFAFPTQTVFIKKDS